MFKYVVEALDSKDNIVDQMKVLKKYRYRKGVRKYIDNLILKTQCRNDHDSKYILYCIVKYYYGLDVKDVKPSPIKLTEYYYKREKKVELPTIYTKVEKLKNGDKVIILSGAFKNLEGIVDKVDIENKMITLSVSLFGQETKIELGNNDYVLKEETK